MAYDPGIFQVQETLYKLGYNPGSNVDGLWGPATAQAVLLFRRDAKLPASASAAQADLMDEAFAMALSRMVASSGVSIDPPPASAPTVITQPLDIRPPTSNLMASLTDPKTLIVGGVLFLGLGYVLNKYS